MSILALIAAAGAGTPVDPDPPVDNDGFSIGTSSDPVWVPEGSLTAWRAAREQSDSTLVEVAYTGDSTSFGEGDTSGGYWPTAYLVRELAIADGYNDGGVGHYTRGTSDGVYRPRPIPYDPLVGFHDTGHSGAVSGDGARTPHVVSRPGSWVTWRGEGRYARLVYARNGRYQGNFAWSVDGGALTGTVPYGGFGTTSGFDAQVIDLGTDGMHMVTLTGIGGVPTEPPAVTLEGTSGSLPAGTYWFVVTNAPPTSGESLPSAPASITLPSGGSVRVRMSAPVQNTGMSRVYRATSEAGPYEYVTEVAANNVGNSYTVGAGGAATPGVNPPTVSTAGLSGWPDASVDIEWLTDLTGLVWHRDGSSGTRSNAGVTPSAQYRMGLRASTPVHPRDRRVKLAINVFGINDMQSPPPDNERSEELRANLRTWVDMARAAGASPVLCIPLYERANQKDYIDPGFTERRADRYRQIHRDVAIEKQCTLVDLGSGGALPGEPEGTNPHLNEAQYRAQAAYLWDNCLSL